MKTTRILRVFVAALCLILCQAEVGEAEPMGTAFTYQGRLMDKHKPADGFYDFRFRLYDSNDPCTATPLGSPIDINDLDVIDGHFVVELDFGSGIFDGNAVWLETRVVRSPLGSDPCSLRPLLEVTPAPYAMYASRAGGVQVPLHLSGSSDSAIIRGTNSSTGPGVHGFSNSGHGVFGRHSSGNSGCLGSPSAGVHGQTSTGRGVFGYASAGSGLNYGVYGGTNSSTGYAGYFSGNARVTRDLVVDANVGIGTTSPEFRLEVSSDTAPIIGLSGPGLTTRHIGISRVYDSLNIARSGIADDLVIDSNGNVGIGTTSPTSLLDVCQGSIRASRESDQYNQYIEIKDIDASGGFITGHSREDNKKPLYLQALHDGRGSPVGETYISFRVGNESSPTTAMIIKEGGNVGIGKTSPAAKLDVVGTIRASTSEAAGRGVIGWASNTTAKNYGGYFEAEGIYGRGVHGVASNSGNYSNYGGYFEAAGNTGAGVYSEATGTYGVGVWGHATGSQGRGVYGLASDLTFDECYGGYFKATSTLGRGVYGEAGGSQGIGVVGYASRTGDCNNYGGYFEARGEQGRGVYGYAIGSSGRGVQGVASDTADVINYGGYFEASGEQGRGVYGVASNTGNYYNYGGYFRAEGNGGRGVYGEATSADPDPTYTNYGGYFTAAGATSCGVFGYAPGSSAEGVYGYAPGSNGKGVYGWGQSYDFYAGGAGTDYGSSSSIRWKSDVRPIDHPLGKVLSLRGVYFNWDAEHGGHHDVGMIAEEVGEVLPEIVQYEADGKYTSGMDYTKLTPLLVEAVKELKTEKDAEMELLRKENAELRERLAALESIVARVSPLREGGTQ